MVSRQSHSTPKSTRGRCGDVLGATEVKYEDYRKGLAQNLVQLESSLTVRKRKRNCDDNGDEEQEEDSSVPMRIMGGGAMTNREWDYDKPYLESRDYKFSSDCRSHSSFPMSAPSSCRPRPPLNAYRPRPNHIFGIMGYEVTSFAAV